MRKFIADNVSIVVPNYNHAEQMKVSIRAIVEQSTSAAEIIIVDDASTDHSLQVIEEFSKVNSNIKVLKNNINRGVSSAVLRGIKAAQSKYIIMASADERIEPDMVETLVKTMSQFPEAKLAISNYAEWYPDQEKVVIHGPEDELGMWYLTQETTVHLSPECIHRLLAKGSIALQATTAIFERKALIDIGVYDSNLRWLGDWFVMHALAFRFGVVVVPKTLAVFRRETQSYSASGMLNRQAQTQVLENLFSKLSKPEFRDIGDALIRSPAAMSPFMNSVIRFAFSNILRSQISRATIRWWLGQVAIGRRPGFLRKLVYGSAQKQTTRQVSG